MHGLQEMYFKKTSSYQAYKASHWREVVFPPCDGLLAQKTNLTQNTQSKKLFIAQAVDSFYINSHVSLPAEDKEVPVSPSGQQISLCPHKGLW